METVHQERRAVLRALTLAVPLGMTLPLAGCGGSDAEAATAPSMLPGTTWERYAKPEYAGFSSASVKAFETALYPLETTSAMIVRNGKIAYSYGNIDDVAYLASARKSIVSMLYGKYVANGTINLDATLGSLGIDDNAGLLPIEKTARIRDLLTARSGVYHPAGSPGSAAGIPERGTVTPGTKFIYNNWDFNVVGFLFEKLTGRTIFDAFKTDLADPLGFEDYDASRQRMLGFKTNVSRYLAYHFFLSGRDMARLGVLMANGGRWNDTQLVPADWVAQSTQLRVPRSDIAGEADNGYGYLWWIPTATRTSADWRNAFLANGNYGQFILVMPAINTVIVHRRSVSDEFAVARNLGDTPVNKAGVSSNDFLKLVDGVLKDHV